MNFRAIGLKVAVATAVVAGTAITSAPAQAYDLYSRTLTFGGSAKFNETTGFLDFVDNPESIKAEIGFGTDTETFGALGSNLDVADLNLVFDNVDDRWELGSSIDFITGGLANGIKYTLTSFNLQKVGTGKNATFSADLAGFFTSPKFPTGVDGFGELTTQKGFSLKGSTYSAEISTIPTPALLPGLIGMGVAALRKRKGEASEEAEA